MIRLVDIYESRDFNTLYELLKERTSDQSISHKEMPLWDDHVDFVVSKPYEAWYFIQDWPATYEEAVFGGRRPEVVGEIHINLAVYPNSTVREVGISIFNSEQGKGYGSKALTELMKLHPGQLHANINPENHRSIKFFKRFGFKLIQQTYALSNGVSQKIDGVEVVDGDSYKWVNPSQADENGIYEVSAGKWDE